MKSATFYKLMKEERSHKIGIFIAMIFSCLAALLFYVIDLQNVLLARYSADQKLEHFITNSELQYWTVILVGIAAVVMGISAFGYLHRNKQIDFRHSLPIKRSRAFNVSFINHFLMFLIPFVLLRVIETILPFVFGVGSTDFLKNMAYGTVFYIGAFLLMYLTMILAMLLTGNTVVGACAFAAINVYFPVLINGIMPTYGDLFFRTYAYNAGCMSDLSPGSLIFILMDDKTFSEAFIWHGIWFVGLIILLYVINLLVFKVRKSERHSTALAFPWMAPVIRFLVVIPMALYSGYLLYSVTMSSSLIWLFFGVVLGAWLAHGIMECVFRFDVKGLIAKPVQMGIAVAASILIVVGFMTDVFGYDTYMPQKDNLAYVCIQPASNGNNGHYKWDVNAGNYQGEDLDKALPILQELIDKSAAQENNFGESMIENEPVEYGTYVAKPSVHFTVTYADRSGLPINRSYNIPYQDSDAILRKLWEIDAFKESQFQILKADAGKITELGFTFFDNEDAVNWNKEQIAEFLAIYQKELAAMAYDTVTGEIPVGNFHYTVPKGEDNVYEFSDVYYILPSYKETLAYLKEKGIHVERSVKDVTVTRLKICDYTDVQREYATEDPAVIGKYLDRLNCVNQDYGAFSEYWFVANDREYDGDISLTYLKNGAECDMYVTTDAATYQKLLEQVKK